MNMWSVECPLFLLSVIIYYYQLFDFENVTIFPHLYRLKVSSEQQGCETD